MRSEFYQDLVRRSDILAVARELGLEVRGGRCRCFHPQGHAHGDRTPSLSFDARRNLFRCWVCSDVRGDVVDLVRMVRGVSRQDAVRFLAARLGIPVPEIERAPASAHPGAFRARGRLDPLPSANPAPLPPPPVPEESTLPAERAHAIYAAFLRWCRRPSPDGYLTRERGLSAAILERMRVVWLPDLRTKPVESILREQFPEKELIGSGLFNEWGLVFRHHPAIFPFLHHEQVVFLQGRRVGRGEPKYLSLRRTIPCLYNHDLLETLAPGSPVLLCEGVVDTLTWLDHGAAAVGILGVSGFKEEWLRALGPFQVLLSFDNDEPGRKAAQTLRARFAAAGQEARIVSLPEGVKDVNQLFVERPDLLARLPRFRGA